MQLTEVQEQWLQALESGEYARGNKRLIRDGAYCCLGVFCAIQPDVSMVDCNAFMVQGSQMDAMLSEPLVSRLGLHGMCGPFSEVIEVNGRSFGSLSQLNDRTELTFEEIARVIRTNPEKVFVR